MSQESTDTPIIQELLAVVGCQAFYSDYGDFNLPLDMIESPAPLGERATQTLQEIMSLTGNWFKVVDRTHELFYGFLARLGESYSSDAVQQFTDWVNRHGIDNDYYACLTLWGYTLSSFDGWALYQLLEKKQVELQKRVFAIYQRLLTEKKNLSPSWIEGMLKNVQDRLETLRSTGYRDCFVEHYSLSEQMNTIGSLMNIERSYRFLADLMREGSEEEIKQVIDCAIMLGTNSGWESIILDKLLYFYDKNRGWLINSALSRKTL